jgi:hypothetical protein
MPVQAGKNPDKLAWHDCEFVLARAAAPATIEDTRSVLLGQMKRHAYEAAPAELIAMLEAIAKFEGPGDGDGTVQVGGGQRGQLLTFLQRRE